MSNSFCFPFVVSSALCFLSVGASATNYFGEELDSEISDTCSGWYSEVYKGTALMKNPCLMMLAKNFRDNSETGKPCGFRAVTVKSLIVIAKTSYAKERSDEGIRLKQNFFGKGNLCYKGLEVLWDYEPCTSVKHHLDNPFFLSYADLYVFYRIKGLLKGGSPLADLWEILFFNQDLYGDESGSSAEK